MRELVNIAISGERRRAGGEKQQKRANREKADEGHGASFSQSRTESGSIGYLLSSLHQKRTARHSGSEPEKCRRGAERSYPDPIDAAVACSHPRASCRSRKRAVTTSELPSSPGTRNGSDRPFENRRSPPPAPGPPRQS